MSVLLAGYLYFGALTTTAGHGSSLWLTEKAGSAPIYLGIGYSLHGSTLLSVEGRCATFDTGRVCYGKLGEPTNLEKTGAVRQEPGGNFIVDRAFKTQLLAARLPELMRDTGAEATIKAGTLVGFTLFGIDEGGPLWRIGLRDEDLLLSLNGLALTDAAKAIQILRSLQEADSVEVEVERSSVRKVWKVEFK